jgi:ATP-dependent Lhr-like helicase
MVAQILLLLENWFEPPHVQGAHLSTLVQQLLSSIAQTGGATAGQLYSLLCAAGAPFPRVSKTEFIELLKHLGQKEMLLQDSSGVLLHGRLGEKFVNHYSFYAAFAADEEFRIVAGGKTLGTLPVTQMLTVGQRILFAGKTWRVEQIDEPQKTIFVSHASGGVPPLFSGGGGRTHTRVRQRMRQVLEDYAVPLYLDDTARRFLAEARDCYKRMDLANQFVVNQGAEVLLLTWLGDAANEAIACLLIRRGYTAIPSGPGVEVLKGRHTTDEILDALMDAAIDEPPPLDMLLMDVQNLQREKWDWVLPDGLLRKTYASHHLDLNEALDWAKLLDSGINQGSAAQGQSG